MNVVQAGPQKEFGCVDTAKTRKLDRRLVTQPLGLWSSLRYSHSSPFECAASRLAARTAIVATITYVARAGGREYGLITRIAGTWSRLDQENSG